MPNEEQTSNKIAKLIQQLNSKRIADVNRAVEDLGNFKSPKAQNKLFEIITNTPSSKKWDYQIRVRAIKSLSRKNLDKRLKEELVNIIEKPQLNKELRREALTQIANIGDSKYIDILKNNLKDPYMFIRMWAVRGLLKINNTQSKSALVPALGDDDETLRKDVYSHLEYAGSEIIPALKANLDSSDSNKHVKYGVAGLLGNITDAKAVPVLCDALKNGNDRVVNIAIRALGKHENILAIKPLLDLYSSEKRFENYIDITLTKIIRARKNSSVAKLVALSSTDDKETYAFIVKLLKKQIPDSVIILGEFLTTDGLEKEVTNKINALMGAIE